MRQPIEEYTWVFIGCGGTFYAASPYLAVLHQRYNVNQHKTFLYDPDVVAPNNWHRQWPGTVVGASKIVLAAIALNLRSNERVCVEEVFDPNTPELAQAIEGRPVIAIVNVDNNATRLQVAEWLESRSSSGIMIVSGCEKDHGQCYPGIWEDGEPVYDWRPWHEDVTTAVVPTNPCDRQTIHANALTGVCVGSCIEDVVAHLGTDEPLHRITEFYWDYGQYGHGLTLYSMDRRCRTKEVEV